MRNRLLLEEENPQPESVNPISEEEIVNFNIGSLITDLIKNKWEQVDSINGLIITLSDVNPEWIKILKDIISDEYIHVGQLEKIVQSMNPKALDIVDNEGVIK